MKKQIAMNVIALLAIFAGIVYASDEERGFQFSAHEYNGTDFIYPAFKFAVIMSNGDIVGWDKTIGQWTGNITKSEVLREPFDYPGPGNECTSSEPGIVRQMNPTSALEIVYTTRSALYCKDVMEGSNSFIGTGYGVNIGGAGTSNAIYTIIIYPEKHTIINMCLGYSIENEEPHNHLCTDSKFNRSLIISSGIDQRLEFYYDFNLNDNVSVEKIVTPSTLSGSWESCNSLGMIKNRGLYNSIKQKLDNASRKAASGDQKAAANIYSAVANELKAQYGKGIDRMCADILIDDLKAKGFKSKPSRHE